MHASLLQVPSNVDCISNRARGKLAVRIAITRCAPGVVEAESENSKNLGMLLPDNAFESIAYSIRRSAISSGMA